MDPLIKYFELLQALKNRGSAAGMVELQADTLFNSKELQQGVNELMSKGLVQLYPDKYPDLGGMVELTVKGLKK